MEKGWIVDWNLPNLNKFLDDGMMLRLELELNPINFIVITLVMKEK